MNNLKQYYTLENCKRILDAIENPKWRIWKTVDIDGLCRQSKFTISSPLDLRKFIMQCKNPQALYVSISEFLNPGSNHGFFANQKVKLENGKYLYPRAGYIYADCILLDSIFFVDADDENIELAQEDARKIINCMKQFKEFEFKELKFSGTKGVHLDYKRKKKPIEPNPIERIRAYRKQNRFIVNQLRKLKLKTFDDNHFNIMEDVFRVRAAPYSIKPSGRIVEPIDSHSFMHASIHELLSSEGKPDDEKVASVAEKSVTSQLYQDGKRITGPSFRPTYFRFVDNMVHGLKNNYVTVIKKNKKKFNLKKLQAIQKTYNLSDFYLLETKEHIYAYNFKLVQFERLVKILRTAKSVNIMTFLSRKHLPMIMSDIYYNPNEVAEEMNFIGTLKSNNGLYHAHSKPHCTMFGKLFMNMAGGDAQTKGTMAVVS